MNALHSPPLLDHQSNGCFSFEWKRSTPVTLSLIITYHSCWQQNFLYCCEVGVGYVTSWLTYIEICMSKTMLFTQLTLGQQMVTFSLLAIHGVSKHSFTQEAMWRKGPNDHLPLVSTTMGPILPKCAEGGWPLCWPGGGWGKVLEVWKKKATHPL